jgi:AcrR family transcriptional regulator
LNATRTNRKASGGRSRRYARGVATGTRERILEAACDLIASDGIDDVRIARVANRAGASTALVHHYFSTREELLEQALLHSFDRVADDRFGGQNEPGESATAALVRTIDECLPLPGIQERDWVLWVELWLRAARDPALRPVAAQLYERYRDWVAEAIRAGIETGEFTATDPDALAERTMAFADGFGIRALLRDPQVDTERARREIAELLAAELGLEPGALG